MPKSDKKQHGLPLHRLVGFFAGPVTAAIVLLSPSPEGLSQQGWWIAAIGIWMAIWWMTETLPLAVTALLPVVVFPILGIQSIETTTTSYAHPLIFLFLGGFLLARAMNVWRLDKRLALKVLSAAGSSPRRVIAAIMAVTAFLSMWVSNTATAMVMLPIGLSIATSFQDHRQNREDNVVPALLLGVAYAATIGGIGTLIGTPPNALFAAFMAESHGIDIGFFRWMLIGIPIVLILLPTAWFLLTHIAFHVGKEQSRQASEIINQKFKALTPMSQAEYLLATLMVLVAAGWIFRPLLVTVLPGFHISDAGIAMTGALLLFLLPAGFKRGRFLLSWKEAAGIRWDVLILFGGGLALATAIGNSDLAVWAGNQLTKLQTLPFFFLLLVIGMLIVFVGELASNTAMAAVFLPIAGATAVGMGESAMLLTLPVALFATLGFMLPVATPPNAIVFGSGSLELRHMLRAGAILDIVGIVIVTLAVMALGKWVLG